MTSEQNSGKRFSCAGRAGFTLVELLVALAVFSAMAALAYGGLSSVVKTRIQLVAQQQAFTGLVRSVSMLERDLREAVARPVRGNYGEPLPALAGDLDHIEFTRIGFANPMAELRSNLERVQYRLEDSQLQRGVYSVLDRAPATSARFTDLRQSVKTLRFRYMDNAQRWWDQWPPLTNSSANGLPRAVEFKVELADYGEIARTIELVAAMPAVDPAAATEAAGGKP